MLVTLENGVHVYDLGGSSRALVKLRSNIPLVTIAVGTRGGAHFETAGTAGLTALLARMSIKGTTSRTAAQIAEMAEGMGGSISPSVSSDMIDWEITVPARHFERALELLCDVAFNPAFPVDEFEVERKLVLADLQQIRDDMYRYPLRLCIQQAFRGHAYGMTVENIERSIRAVASGAVAAWHHEQVRKTPCLFVVGDVVPDEAARAIAAQLPAISMAEERAMDYSVWRGGAIAAETREKAQTALALAFPGPARNHEDTYTVQVLANAVGGLGGRFFEELRSKRSLAYSINLLPITRWLGGAFVAYIATSPEREDEARQALLEQFTRLVNEPLPAADVQRAQRYMIGSRQIRSQTNVSQVGELMHAYLLGRGVSELAEFEERIRAVTPAAILAAAQRYFDPAVVVQGIVRGKGQPNGS
jgi:zinc protease